ncbi:MAG: hypothetical protein OXF74_11515 [Rhodobacteraceae bacterium]|nr:hypothetical protein [Paracoccaceae bacterium]
MADGRLMDPGAALILVHVIETYNLFRALRVRHMDPDITVKRLLVALERQGTGATPS